MLNTTVEKHTFIGRSRVGLGVVSVVMWIAHMIMIAVLFTSSTFLSEIHLMRIILISFRLDSTFIVCIITFI